MTVDIRENTDKNKSPSLLYLDEPCCRIKSHTVILEKSFYTATFTHFLCRHVQEFRRVDKGD